MARSRPLYRDLYNLLTHPDIQVPFYRAIQLRYLIEQTRLHFDNAEMDTHR